MFNAIKSSRSCVSGRSSIFRTESVTPRSTSLQEVHENPSISKSSKSPFAVNRSGLKKDSSKDRSADSSTGLQSESRSGSFEGNMVCPNRNAAEAQIKQTLPDSEGSYPVYSPNMALTASSPNSAGSQSLYVIFCSTAVTMALVC